MCHSCPTGKPRTVPPAIEAKACRCNWHVTSHAGGASLPDARGWAPTNLAHEWSQLSKAALAASPGAVPPLYTRAGRPASRGGPRATMPAVQLGLGALEFAMAGTPEAGVANRPFGARPKLPHEAILGGQVAHPVAPVQSDCTTDIAACPRGRYCERIAIHK
eukprot:scaffold996_cov409-Prasinococcus_capsulatus_cf.AAC.31